jgi:predicted ATP-dependent Lon-type protease
MNRPNSYYQKTFMEGDVSDIRILDKENDRFKLLFKLTYKKKYFDKVKNIAVENTTVWDCEVRSKYAEVLSKKLTEGMFVIIECELKEDDTVKKGVKLIVSFVTPRFFEEELNG